MAVTLPVEDRLSAAEYVDLAALAERSGYDAVLAGEVAGPEVFSLLGMIAARTTSIRIGSGVVGCYARPPALTAMGFATLASCAPGRVIAGVGVSSPIIVERWFGLEFERPLATARDFIAILRRALSGEPVTHAGGRLHADGFRAAMTVPPARSANAAGPAVPILLAAMNPAMLRLAGRTADGVFLTWTSPAEIGSRLAHVRSGERRAGRPEGQVWAAASFWAYCGPRQEEALERMRRVVLQYA
ncbi:MAG: LLM class flavin-dependent oxidoreductase, partial [Streptosporangiales bacterium]|nr:LLM class flavin-dependent oxidoreductase [Streptosporangiales bacterium]